MLARILVEIPPPYDRPESRQDAEGDERKTPGEPSDQEGDDRRRGARAETPGGMGDTDSLAAGGERGPFRQRPRRRRQCRTLAHAEHQAHPKERDEPGYR